MKNLLKSVRDRASEEPVKSPLKTEVVKNLLESVRDRAIEEPVRVR